MNSKTIISYIKEILLLINIMLTCLVMYTFRTSFENVSAKLGNLKTSVMQNSRETSEKLDIISLDTNKSQEVLLNYIQKSDKILSDLTATDLLDLQMSTAARTELLKSLSYNPPIQSSGISLNGVILGSLLTILCITAIVVYFNNPITLWSNWKTEITNIINLLPGSNSSSGTEYVDHIGLVIKTRIIHGDAKSIYISSLDGKVFDSIISFMNYHNSQIASLQALENITTISTHGDLTGII